MKDKRLNELKREQADLYAVECYLQKSLLDVRMQFDIVTNSIKALEEAIKECNKLD